MAEISDERTAVRYAPRHRTRNDARTAPKTTAQGQSRELHFTIVCLCIGLFGNRFGIAIGTSHLSFVGPAILFYTVASLMRGYLSFHKARSALFFLLSSLTLVSVAAQMVHPDRFAVGFSLLSFMQFLILTSIATICFTQPVDEVRFFRAVNTIFAIIAAAGIIQFLAQFAGLFLFSFKDFLPENFTYETGYHLEIPIGETKYFKSNGFFLLEPSIFSQYMAMALCIEILVLRRVRYIMLLLVALVMSLSGTGWIMLGSFITAVAVGMKTRGLVLALSTAGLLGGALIVLAVISPDFFDLFWGRVGEFGAPGSSAHDRFIAPFWVLSDVVARAPWALWAGIGAGGGGRVMTSITYEFNQNTPIKLVIEFGLPVMLAYTALLVTGKKTLSQVILLVPAMVMLYFNGETAQLPPVLYPILLTICLPVLTTSASSSSLLD